jgi:hypothetical protein
LATKSAKQNQLPDLDLPFRRNPALIMKTAHRPALLVCLLAAGLTGWSAEAGNDPGSDRVTVNFTSPENFTDLREGHPDFENERGREHFLPLFRKYLVQRAGKLLPAGQKLAVTFTDIDLAGDFEPWLGMPLGDVRIVRSVYVPRLAMHFTLTDAGGQVLKEGGRKLLDSSFQLRSHSGIDSDSLRYEKEMLNDWLRQEILPRKN